MDIKMLRLSALTLFLLLVAPVAHVSAQEETPEQPVPDAQAKLTNYLEIDRATGAVVAEIYRGAEVTDVRIVGVDPSETGFGLIDPYGVKVWLDQVSTSTGEVEFWYTRLVMGDYVVVQTALGIDIPLVVFQPPSTLTNSPIDLCGIVGSVDTRYQLTARDEQFVRTPLIFLHSPYGKRSDGTQGEGWANLDRHTWSAIYIFPGELGSGRDYSSTLNAKHGQSYMYYQSAKWGLYQRGYYTCGGWVNTGTSAKVYEWGSERGMQQLTEGSSVTSDQDDQNVFCNSTGTTCLTANIRYASSDFSIPGCTGTGILTESVSSRQAFRVGGSISVSGTVVSMEVFKAEVGWGKSYRYTYQFPCGISGTWYVDELPTESLRTHGWAFRKA